MLRFISLLTYLVLGISMPGIAIASSVSAKKDGTQVTAEPKKGAAVIRELKKGESLEAKDRSGMFWKVTTPDGKEGYVSVMAVQRAAAEESGIQKELHNAALEARASGDTGSSTRSRSAVMGVRGLDEKNDMGDVGNLRPDLKAVYRMEDRVVSVKRVNRLESLVFKEVENTLAANK